MGVNSTSGKPVDFTSLAYHGCNIKEFYEAQDLLHYFDMLNGPTYVNLIRNFWVRASVYDKHAAKLEMEENVLIHPSLVGKSREEGLEELLKVVSRMDWEIKYHGCTSLHLSKDCSLCDWKSF